MSHNRPLCFWMLSVVLASSISACATNPESKSALDKTDLKTIPSKKWDQAKSQPSNQAPAAPLNSVAQAANKGGIVSCAQRINQVTNFLTANSQSGAFLFLSPTEPDKTVASASLEIRSGNASAYATTSVAPVGSDGCGALYETIAYWESRCEDVARKAFSGLRSDGVLKRSIAMLNGGPTMRVFLMPAANRGCISIKKEMVY